MKTFEFLFFRKRVSLVSRLLAFPLWLTLSPRLSSVPPEESRELSLFPVLIKVTCSLPRSPKGPGSNSHGEGAEHLSRIGDTREKIIRCFLSIGQ